MSMETINILAQVWPKPWPVWMAPWHQWQLRCSSHLSHQICKTGDCEGTVPKRLCESYVIIYFLERSLPSSQLLQPRTAQTLCDPDPGSQRSKKYFLRVTDAHWHSMWHLTWHIFWHSIWNLFWHPLEFYLRFNRAYFLTFSGILWHSIWHFFLAFFPKFYLAFYLTFYLAHFLTFYHSVWHFIWHSFRHSIGHFKYLAFFLLF